MQRRRQAIQWLFARHRSDAVASSAVLTDCTSAKQYAASGVRFGKFKVNQLHEVFSPMQVQIGLPTPGVEASGELFDTRAVKSPCVA